MSMALDTLPNEILRLICLHLVADGVYEPSLIICDPNLERLKARRALSSLSQTCSVLQAVAQPELFRGFSDLHDRELLLLQTVIQKPELGQYVERLDLTSAGGKFVRYDKGHPPHDHQIFRLDDTPIEAAIRGLEIDFADEWVEQLREDEKTNACEPVILWDCLLALYLAVFPRVKHITFCWPSDYARFVGKLIVEASRLIPSWQVLCSLSILNFGYGYDLGRVAFDGISGFLAWPSVQTLKLYDMKIATIFDLALVPSSSLRNIYIYGCSMSKTLRRAIVNSCKELEQFAYANSDPDLADAQAEFQAPLLLIRDLQAHTRSLQLLHLGFIVSYEELEAQPDLDENATFHISSLKEFVSLKELILDIRCILEPPHRSQSVLSNLLPSSIRDLTLLHVDDHSISIVESFPKDVGKFSNLKSVTVYMDECDPSYYRLYKDIFSKRNVDYRIEESY